jgi:hypothetical protein
MRTTVWLATRAAGLEHSVSSRSSPLRLIDDRDCCHELLLADRLIFDEWRTYALRQPLPAKSVNVPPFLRLRRHFVQVGSNVPRNVHKGKVVGAVAHEPKRDKDTCPIRYHSGIAPEAPT